MSYRAALLRMKPGLHGVVARTTQGLRDVVARKDCVVWWLGWDEMVTGGDRTGMKTRGG